MDLIKKYMLILKSASPRRKEILENLGLKFIVSPSNINEEKLLNEKPEEFLKRVTLEKLQMGDLDNITAISSDTIVVFEEEVLQKPVDQKVRLRLTFRPRLSRKG